MSKQGAFVHQRGKEPSSCGDAGGLQASCCGFIPTDRGVGPTRKRDQKITLGRQTPWRISIKRGRSREECGELIWKRSIGKRAEAPQKL